MKLLTLSVSLFLGVSVRAAQITVHAASSLADVMKEVAPAYEKQSGDKVRLNFDASSILARQIEEGAPADLFLSADEAKMDALEEKNLLAPGTRKSLLSNTLVIVVPTDSNLPIHSAADLANNGAIKKIALAQPSTVPAGIYSKEYLTKSRLWDKVSPKVIPTQNVRAALAAVESGNVEAGFVYKTDALGSRQVKIACEIPAAEGPKISYPVAALAASPDLAAAKKFLAYLESDAALAVFRRYGFSRAK
ncbi:MAG: molybdate ABC transporter substrate-binding protein [Chthoniobacterales bacterium]|nr:molybdate ABC transporter substrate-binding protein [Chthoniobacterales bacterium]